jgi:hypothetical protein
MTLQAYTRAHAHTGLGLRHIFSVCLFAECVNVSKGWVGLGVKI